MWKAVAKKAMTLTKSAKATKKVTRSMVFRCKVVSIVFRQEKLEEETLVQEKQLFYFY